MFFNLNRLPFPNIPSKYSKTFLYLRDSSSYFPISRIKKQKKKKKKKEKEDKPFVDLHVYFMRT